MEKEVRRESRAGSGEGIWEAKDMICIAIQKTQYTIGYDNTARYHSSFIICALVLRNYETYHNNTIITARFDLINIKIPTLDQADHFNYWILE